VYELIPSKILNEKINDIFKNDKQETV